LRAHGGRIAEENRIRSPVSASVRLSLTRRAAQAAPAQRPPRAHARTHFETLQDRDVALAGGGLGDIVEHQRGAVLGELQGSSVDRLQLLLLLPVQLDGQDPTCWDQLSQSSM